MTKPSPTKSSAYIGRFAPSPSGPLHLGSLVTALASFLRARSQSGRWLVRIDDIDPPREVAGASEQILRSLETHGLLWDGEVLFQSQRIEAYQAAIAELQQAGLTYACECTRKQVKTNGPYYTGTCRHKNLTNAGCALRFRNDNSTTSLVDLHLGTIQADPQATNEDFIIRRKDGLFAYHLAAVVDDIFQRITEVVRGADLLQPTLCQLALYKAMNTSPPAFIHLPVISTASGVKLSKQNHASPIDLQRPQENLFCALSLLGLNPPKALQEETVKGILDWSITHWRMEDIPRKTEILLA